MNNTLTTIKKWTLAATVTLVLLGVAASASAQAAGQYCVGPTCHCATYLGPNGPVEITGTLTEVQ
jgi:hypothetical protein